MAMKKEKKTHHVVFKVPVSLNRLRKRVEITWPQAAEKGIRDTEIEQTKAMQTA